MQTVGEYIKLLEHSIDTLCDLCLPDVNCAKCPLQKAEGKCCPVNQLRDIKRTLVYAIDHGVHGITTVTDVQDALVVLLIKRAVILGYSVYTLRPCDTEYIKLRNLLPVPMSDGFTE